MEMAHNSWVSRCRHPGKDQGMKHQFMLAAAARFTLAAGTVAADCVGETAALGDGIAKDGSTAPLAAPATPQTGSDTAETTTPSAEGEGEGKIAKDGSTEPLDTDPALATSAEDAQAQSEGGETAAEQAQDEDCL